MGFSTHIMFVLGASDEIHEATVRALQNKKSAAWTIPVAVASYDQVTVVALTGPDVPASYLSANLPSDTTVISVNVFDSDVAEVRGYESGEMVAEALFGFAYIVAMSQEFNEMAELGLAGDATPSPVPTEPISGLTWWSAILNVPTAQVKAMVDAQYAFAEEQVQLFLDPLGISAAMIELFGPDVIAEPGSARVTGVSRRGELRIASDRAGEQDE